MTQLLPSHANNLHRYTPYTWVAEIDKLVARVRGELSGLIATSSRALCSDPHHANRIRCFTNETKACTTVLTLACDTHPTAGPHSN
jgi:hypothetical protein